MDTRRTRRLGAVAAGGPDAFLRSLSAHGRVTIDTCCCVYYLSSSSEHHVQCRQMFLEAARGVVLLEVSGITYLELLVKCFESGEARDLQVVLSLLKQQAGVRLHVITETVLMAAAQIRAVTRLKAPDALVAATAVLNGSSALVSNDAAFKRIPEMGMLRLPLPGFQPIPMPQYIHLDDFAVSAES